MTDKTKKSILIVEDDPFIGDDFRAFLEEEGYNVMLFDDGIEARGLMEGGLPYQLAIIDISLPHISGIDLINLSKSQRPDVPVISISGYSESDFKYPLPSDSRLKKPIFSADLISVVRSYFDKTE